MKHKALTVAIAGALAAPLAAQAVDFTVSGHVNRAIVISDNDSGKTSGTIKDNGSSGTRFRMVGSSELDGGMSGGFNFELGQAANLRKASVNFAGAGFGSIVLGLDSEAADSRAYSDKSGVFGIAHGQEMGGIASAGYFGGLSGAGSAEGLHYTTPAFGPVALQASVAGDDRYSVSLKLATATDFASVGGEVGILEHDNEGVAGERTRTIGGSLGIALANGLTWSAAWAQGNNVGGADDTDLLCVAADPDSGAITSTPWVAGVRPATCSYTESIDPALPWSNSNRRWVNPNTAKASTDPSYVQTTVGYILGNNHVGVSFYRSSDFVTSGSEGTAIGIGVLHNMPKAGVDIYAAGQTYQVQAGAVDTTDNVIVVGAKIAF